MEGLTIPRIEAPIGMDKDDDDLEQFAEKSMEEMRDHITQNRMDAATFKDMDDEPKVNDVLANHNVRSLDIRARPLENPKVTLWLKDCPVWANDAWTDTIYPRGLNAFNGKVTVTFDVRPF